MTLQKFQSGHSQTNRPAAQNSGDSNCSVPKNKMGKRISANER